MFQFILQNLNAPDQFCADIVTVQLFLILIYCYYLPDSLKSGIN